MQRVCSVLVGLTAVTAATSCTDPTDPGEYESGAADTPPTLAQVRESFAQLAQTAQQQFDKAGAMKLIEVADGAPITSAQCDAIAAQVRPNYKIDPFKFDFENGTTFAPLCSSPFLPTQRFAVLTVSGTSNLGLPYVRVLQRGDARPEAAPFVTRVFLDSNHRIVEEQYVDLDPVRGSPEFVIKAVDAAGNYYELEWTKSLIYDEKEDVRGTSTRQRFVAADGSTPSAVWRHHIAHPSDPAKDFTHVWLSRADRQDWQDFQLPITYGWSGGFYSYGGKYRDWPKFSTTLQTKFRGSQEHCAMASISADSTGTDIPGDGSYWTCFNYP